MPSVAAHLDAGTPSGPAGMPHLAGPAASLRQAMAAHFVDGLAHVVEIGGHLNPVSGYLHHVPESFLCVDPKAQPLVGDTLNDKPCKVRHIARKFQDVEFDLDPGYGLVFVGYSLKPYGKRDPVGEKLFSLIDNSAVTVIEFSTSLARATEQMQSVLSRPQTSIVCSVDYRIDDGAMSAGQHGDRRLVVLKPRDRK
jgi:hypothetical protein